MDTYRKSQYERAQERDAALNGKCLLCHLNVPGGTGWAEDYHEIAAAGMGGKFPKEIHYALYNIVQTCRMHHNRFQHLPLIWMKAMVQIGLAQERDYYTHPDIYPEWEKQPYPLLAQCFGEFGYGERYFGNQPVPGSIVLALAGVSNLTFHFCRDCCPQASSCLMETREAFKRGRPD